MTRKKVFVLFCLLGKLSTVLASVHDCWDPEKLQRMSFSNKVDDDSDPGLSQFSKMVKCLSAQQGKGSGSTLETDWNQWANMAGGLPPNWNDRQQANNRPGALPPGMQQPPPGMMHPGMQPEPGVHPDDWGRVRTADANPGWPPRAGGGVDPSWPPRPSGQDPAWPPGRGVLTHLTTEAPPPYKDRQDRKRNRKLQPEEERRRLQLADVAPEQRFDQATWNNPNPMDIPKDRDYTALMNPEETAAVSLSRKYGYAIMALSVVVLAVLMVATIFCCNSSNSTMSQAGNQNLPVNQFDTYSMYSYKGGVGDTLRSTGTLGGMSMHTETLKSMQSRGSPQYRVSDIDPDFARRFKENQQY